jgi:molybdenum cofactor cytidylyltransferase
VITTLRQAEIEQVLVVLGPHGEALAAPARAAGAEVLVLLQKTPEMRATVEVGLAHLEEFWHPTADDAWLLIPADHPTLEAGVVRQLVQAYTVEPSHSLIVPTYQGRRGHPTLIAWRHVAALRKLPAGQGLNVYLREQETHELPVTTPVVLDDLDTPADYERLLKVWAGERRP